MTRLPSLALVLALFGPIACGDNGTVLGSAANGGAGGATSGGNASGGSSGSSNPSSGGTSAGTGAAGSSAGAASGGSGGGGPCGGATCGAEQICCGPPECGHCVSELSGAFCGFECMNCTVNGDCKSVVQNVAARLAEAQVCDPSTMPEPQCPAQVSDGCGCTLSVVSQDAPATQCYLEALAQLNSMPGCYTCVPSPCVPPSGQCSGDGSGTMQCQ